MEGTIDVQIKHKDGSIETRHEHNVVFDLQALAVKRFYEQPYATMTGGLSFKYISSSTYDRFSLSTMEIDTTKPSFLIAALKSITSGSSSEWYTAPITSTIESKYRISSATWTVGEAITLKSIFFPYSSVRFFQARGSKQCVSCADGLYVDNVCTRLKPISNVYKFTNKYLCGFNNDASTINGNNIEYAFVPYKLHDPSERFLFVSTANPTTSGDWVPSWSDTTLQIKDAAINTVKRSFLLSRFEGYSTTESMRWFTRVINTGTKNFLLQRSSYGLKAWEIPDSESEATIPVSGTILSDSIYFYASERQYTYFDCVVIVDNIIGYRKRSASDKFTFAKINDDLSVEIVPGANAAGAILSASTAYDNTSVWPYMNTDSVFFARAIGQYDDKYVNSGTYYCHFFNSTAANFSTPIVLAEGDVLTVSYKIEVA